MTYPLPEDTERVTRWLRQRGIATDDVELLPDVGFVNWVYRVGSDLILRISKNSDGDIDGRTDAIAVPAARKAGIVTPALLEFDDSYSIFPTVVTLFERASGVTLGRQHVQQGELPSLYQDLGRQIGQLHRKVKQVEDPAGWLDKPEFLDARAELTKARAAMKVEQLTYDWLFRWLDVLEPAIAMPGSHVFLHNDLHSFNVMVELNPLRLTSILDWGDAGWGDPVLEFETFPIWAVDWVLEGYADWFPELDPGFCGRLLWHNLAVALETTVNPWVETDEPWQPLTTSRWINMIRFFATPVAERWREWAPPAS